MPPRRRLTRFDEKAENDANRIKQEIAEEEKNLALMKAGSRPDEIEKAEADVKRLEGVYDNISQRSEEVGHRCAD